MLWHLPRYKGTVTGHDKANNHARKMTSVNFFDKKVSNSLTFYIFFIGVIKPSEPEPTLKGARYCHYTLI